MVWKYGDVQLKAGKGWTDKDGTKHPNNWMLWDDYYKTTMGLKWEDDPDTSYDDRFYWAKDVPRSLTDINEVDENGDAILDEDGNQVVTLGLKSIWVAKTKTTANGLLASSDWYVTRKAETDEAIPSTITTYRTAVRTASGTIETAINGCDDLDAFMALFEGEDGGNPVMNNFPESI
jgi:hypothetical protein